MSQQKELEDILSEIKRKKGAASAGTSSSKDPWAEMEAEFFSARGTKQPAPAPKASSEPPAPPASPVKEDPPEDAKPQAAVPSPKEEPPAELLEEEKEWESLWSKIASDKEEPDTPAPAPVRTPRLRSLEENEAPAPSSGTSDGGLRPPKRPAPPAEERHNTAAGMVEGSLHAPKRAEVEPKKKEVSAAAPSQEQPVPKPAVTEEQRREEHEEKVKNFQVSIPGLDDDEQQAPPRRRPRQQPPEEEEQQPQSRFQRRRGGEQSGEAAAAVSSRSKQSAGDQESFEEALARTKKMTSIQLACALIGVIGMLWLHISNVYLMPWIPKAMYPETEPLVFMAVSMVVLLIPVLGCCTVIGSGLISLFTLKANNDSLTALSMLAALAQCAILLVKPELLADSTVHLYFYVPVLSLAFNLVGKMIHLNRVARGYKMTSDSHFDKYAVCQVENRELSRELGRGLDTDIPTVAYSSKIQRFTDYEELANEEDFSDNFARLLGPVCLGASLVVALIYWFVNKNIAGTLTVFSALTAVCAPFTVTLAAALPLGRMSRVLHKDGAMVAGYQSAESFAGVDAVVLRATDLFPASEVILYNVKTFAEKRIDEALLDAASVICASDSTLTGVFSKIIQGQTKLLKPVENIVYEDGMGLSAWVNKKRVLIGNRQLMKKYGIDLPSRDYELKFVRDNRDILYLANSGELSAMFVLGYNPAPEVQEAIDKLNVKGYYLIVNTNDPNVTAEKISRLFDFPADGIKIMPSTLKPEMERLSNQPTARAEVAHMGSLTSMVSALCAAEAAKTAVSTGVIIQLIGIVLGYGILAFFAFAKAMEFLTPDLLVIYLIIWGAVAVLIPRLQKM